MGGFMKKNLKSILFYVVFVAVTVAVIMMIMGSMKEKAKTPSDLIDLFKQGEVVSYVWNQYTDKLTVTDKAENELTFSGISEVVYENQILPMVAELNGKAQAYADYLTALEQYEKDKDAFDKGELKTEPVKPEEVEKPVVTQVITFNYKEPKTIPFWVNFLPYLFLGVILVVMWIVFSKQMNSKDGSRGVGRARPKLASEEKNKIFFKDVAGCDEEKEELTEIGEFLRDPAKFTRLGA